MKNTRATQSFLSRIAKSSALALLLTSCFASVSHAAIDGQYNVIIGESPRYLEAVLKMQRGEITPSELYTIKYEESCKNPSIRLWDRNRPALLVQNTSGAGELNSISSFVIDLEQAGFEFGIGDVNGDFNGLLVQPNVRSDAGVGITANYVAGDTTKLQVNFTGLTVGKAAIFRIDLDPIPMIDVVYPDYRGIILGADIGQGATSPALISTTFSEPGQADRSTPLVAFSGEFDGAITSGLLEVYHAQTRTEMFDNNGGTVPEPATLSMLALAGLGFIGRPRRKV